MAETGKQTRISGAVAGDDGIGGLLTATIAMLLNTIFVLHGAAHGRGAFYGPPVGVWLLLGRLWGVLWLSAVLGAASGKGNQRIPLAVWSVLVLQIILSSRFTWIETLLPATSFILEARDQCLSTNTFVTIAALATNASS
jgi:hypothetical protein